MSIERLLTQTATIRRVRPAVAGATDVEGNWAPGLASETTYPCRLERGHGGRQSQTDTEETYDQGAERMASTWLLFLPAAADITGRDLVVVDGRKFEVEGEPNVLRAPQGPHHVEAFLSSVE